MFALNALQIPSILQLQHLVAAIPRNKTKEIVDENLVLVGWLGERGTILELLLEVLRSDQLLATIASRSYRHVNQFDKIVLIGNDDPEAYRITLHLWTPPYAVGAREQELIHGHRFSFWSVVLVGNVSSENYARVASGGGVFREYRYTPEARNVQFDDFYEYAGDTQLARSGEYRKWAGESYFLDASNIHRITLPSEITCTLVLRGPRLQPYSSVFNTRYPDQDTRLPNVMFTSAELEQRLVRLVAAIRSAP
jgi:hypothetical protein